MSRDAAVCSVVPLRTEVSQSVEGARMREADIEGIVAPLRRDDGWDAATVREDVMPSSQSVQPGRPARALLCADQAFSQADMRC